MMPPVFKVQPPQVGDSWVVGDVVSIPVKPPKPFIALCVASRGWGSYRTIAGMLREIKGVPWEEAFAIGEPLPAAQNTCVRKALAYPDVTHLWFVEDDHVLPPGCLDAMLAMISEDRPIVGLDYQLRNGPRCVIRDADGEPVLVGFGSTLMHRSLFSLLPDPPFWVGTRKAWDGRQWIDTGVPEAAGGFDVNACIAVRQAGKRIGVVDGMEAGHLMLVRGGGHVNFGVDTEAIFGGVGLPWAPVPKGANMAAMYFKAPSGAVQDCDPELGGDPQHYLRNGFVEITKAQFEAEQKRQDKAAAAAEKAGA